MSSCSRPGPGRARSAGFRLRICRRCGLSRARCSPCRWTGRYRSCGTCSGCRAIPTIEELPIAETWVGFRPGSRDDAPMLGPSGLDRLVIATGHHRNGILLTPVTAAVVSAYILTERLPEIARPFSPERFATTEHARPKLAVVGGKV